MQKTENNKKPVCILFAAPVGTSKTPIANYLSWNLGLPVFSTDSIRTEVHEDTLSENLDQDMFLKRKEDRLEKIISFKKSFIFDASIDRNWKELKEKLEKAGYRWLIISIDLDRNLISKLYDSKNYTETKDRLDQLMSDHQIFLDDFEKDVSLKINNQNFHERLDLSLKTVMSTL